MFQPFKGKWVQTLGCFLSKGSATGTILHEIMPEAIILAENAGLKVDGIACDGASWNRTMCDKFGVKEEKVSVQHPVDSDRPLLDVFRFSTFNKMSQKLLSKARKTCSNWVLLY